eukprot:7245694-Pyramimonas_sp.AAC.1
MSRRSSSGLLKACGSTWEAGAPASCNDGALTASVPTSYRNGIGVAIAGDVAGIELLVAELVGVTDIKTASGLLRKSDLMRLLDGASCQTQCVGVSRIGILRHDDA